MLINTLRALQVLGCLVAVVTLFVPWHTVREVDWAPCLAPDCHGTASVQEPKACVGLDHFATVEISLVIGAWVAALGLLLLSLARSGWRAIGSGLLGGVLQGLALFWAAVSSSLSHLFSNVVTGAGEYVFVGTGLLLVSTSLIAVIRAIVQSVRARRSS